MREGLATMKRFTWTLLTAAGVSLFGASTTSAGILISDKEIRRQARVEWLSMKRHIPQVPDQRVQRYVQCVANRLISELPPDFAEVDWEVVVFDDDDVNASANPDGKIAVLSGLLNVADTPDSLAAVLGHEIAHATQNHVMQRARQGARTDMLVLLGSAATGIGQDMIRSGATIGLSLPYARDQETEADLVGLQYMAKAGFDPRAAIYLWKGMSAASKGAPPEILSSHPSDDTRLDNIVRAITPALVQYNAAVDAGKRPNCQIAR
jgi:predicted Zn-dependent protease